MSTKTSTMKLTKPDLNDQKGQTIVDLAANFDIIDKLFPVGTIYQSTKATNPSTFIGGTWVQRPGRMLVGAGTDFPIGTTGGEKTTTLTANHMPAGIWTSTGAAATLSNVPTYYAGMIKSSAATAHNNMPPYLAVYIWERTA